MEKRVKIIIANTHLVTGKEEHILSQIAPCYAQKHREIKIQKDAQQELLTGYLLKQYLGVNSDEQLTYNEYFKPSLVSAETFFNISHSVDYVVLALADCEVGIDVEQIRSCHDATVKKVFNTKQKEELQKLTGNQKDEMFTKIWTQCEAMLKLKGTGFSGEWDKDTNPVECSLYTTKLDDYFISCATEESVAIEIEKL